MIIDVEQRRYASFSFLLTIEMTFRETPSRNACHSLATFANAVKREKRENLTPYVFHVVNHMLLTLEKIRIPEIEDG